MFKLDADWFLLFSELFVNLAAGWFGTVLIVPNFPGLAAPFSLAVLTADVFFGILSLLIAFKFRKLAKS